MQVCHGKRGPLSRIAPGHRVAYYSPSTRMGEADGLQSFTALGTVKDGLPYAFDMGGGFVPFRRDVGWDDVATTPIRPLLKLMDFTRGKRNWGYAFRFGVLAVSPADFAVIEAAMTRINDAADASYKPAIATRMPDFLPAAQM